MGKRERRGGRERERDTHTHTHTKGGGETETEKQADRQAGRQTQLITGFYCPVNLIGHMRTKWQTNRRDRQTDRQTETERQRQTDRQTETQTDRGRERQRQTDRQTETATDRQRDRDRDRELSESTTTPEQSQHCKTLHLFRPFWKGGRTESDGNVCIEIRHKSSRLCFKLAFLPPHTCLVWIKSAGKSSKQRELE